MKITVIGSGYVGLVTGSCFADLGVQVACVDIDAAKVDRLRLGDIPIYEPGLSSILLPALESGRLSFTTDLHLAMHDSQVVFIAVGTPADEDGSADLSSVLAAARSIGQVITQFVVVVDKSTVPVGTAELVAAAISEGLAARNSAVDFAVVSNPEFLKEGAAVEDFMRPDRIVLGLPDGELGARARSIMDDLYSPLTRNHQRTIYMDTRSAELTKYAANAMLATRISFMNELANLADCVGADIEAVRLGIGADQRIGYDFLYAGTGYGGSCFPKDIRAIIHTACQHGVEMQLIEAVDRINNKQKLVLLRKLVARFGDNLAGLRFGIWGLSFKPNTDDMRDAPSRVLIGALLERGAFVSAFDPVAKEEAGRVLRDDFSANPEWLSRLEFADNLTAAAAAADALIIVTEWKAFRNPDFSMLRKTLKSRIIFDGRNLFPPERMRTEGFEYYGIGRVAA